MSLPASSRFQFTADLGVCRILNGMWQVSGAHGAIDPARAVEEMFSYHDAGFTTWDLADHYGPAEDFIGAFRRQFATRYGAKRLSEIQAFTKWVPYPGRMTRQVVTNFDTERLRVITDHGIRIVSNQVQYSLVDRRPEAAMAAFCRDHGITLL